VSPGPSICLDLPVRPLCGSPWGMEKVTVPLRRSSNLQVRSGLSDHWTESVQVSDPAFGAAKDVPGGRDAVHSRHLASGRGQDVTTVGPSGHPVKR